jgi:hypothetical protein
MNVQRKLLAEREEPFFTTNAVLGDSNIVTIYQ